MKDGIEVEQYVPSEMTLKYPNFLSSLSHASWVPFRLPSVLFNVKKSFSFYHPSMKQLLYILYNR